MVAIITPEYLARSGTEDGEQSALFCFAGMVARGQMTHGQYPAAVLGHCNPDYRWSLLYAIPNGGKRSAATAGRLKATGVKAGFPDVGLPVALGGFHGLFIELKRKQTMGKRGRLIGGGSTQAVQETWHIKLQNEGYRVVTCHGWEVAAVAISHYLALPKTQ